MGTLTTATVGYSNDHQTAVDGGFDIYEAGYWVRPDNATIRRYVNRGNRAGFLRFYPAYIAVRADDMQARFYTMTEAVEWIGGTSFDPERLHLVEPGEDDR